MSIGRLSWIPLIQNSLLIVDGDPYTVNRTLCERFFSRPWRPWVSAKIITPKIPDPNVYMYPPNGPTEKIIGHPETLKALIDQMEKAQ